MFYDHFLAKNWREYSEVPLPDFARAVYKILQDSRDILPESLKQVVPTIIARDLLCSYREIGGIDIALNRMSLRIKRTNNLAGGVEDLTANYQQFESHFRAFFPDLIIYVTSCRH